tara:strand:- start:6123 stop:6365 length:243 start_codon:yes stop_codon:yes gene_type:complete
MSKYNTIRQAYEEVNQIDEGRFSPKTLKFLKKMITDFQKYERQFERNKEIKYGRFGSFDNKVYNALANARRHLEDLFEDE